MMVQKTGPVSALTTISGRKARSSLCPSVRLSPYLIIMIDWTLL